MSLGLVAPFGSSARLFLLFLLLRRRPAPLAHFRARLIVHLNHSGSMEAVVASAGWPQTKWRLAGGKMAKKKKLRKAAAAAKRKRPTPAPLKASILSLPAEIVLLIAELLDVKDQAALDRTTRFFHQIIDPVLYQDNVKSGGSFCLFWGAENGQLGTIKKAIAAGADLYQPVPDDPGTWEPSPREERGAGDDGDDTAADGANSSDGAKLTKYSTPLHLAAKNGHREVVTFLLDSGVDIDAPSYKMCECKSVKGQHQAVQADYEYPRWRALHLAMCYGEREIAELLIFRGASLSLDAIPGRHHTALHTAAAKGLIPVIKLLALDLKFDANERDANGNTALHYVAELFGARDHDTIRDTISKLLALGAELEAHNEIGHTALLNACCRGNFAVASRLLSIGANPDPHRYIPNFRDYRPLYYAILPRAEFFDLNNAPVKHDDFEGLRINLINSLVETGADVEARFDKRGHRNVTPLMLACEFAEPRVVATLLKAGAHVNSVDRTGKTAILYACSERVDHRGEVPEIVTHLIQHGAWVDIEEHTRPPTSALDWAVKHSRWGDGEVLHAMLKASGAINVGVARLKVILRRCASNGNYKALGPLLEFTKRLFEVSNDDLKDSMDLIIEQRDPANQRETFQTLVDFGYRIESNEVLLLRTMLQKNEILSLAVLERGVAVSDFKLLGGQTYLHIACEWGNMNVLRALLERAADVNAFDRDLRTPLSIVVANNQLDMADALMMEVADPHLLPPDELLRESCWDADECEFVRRRHLTAFDLAIRDSRTEILKAMVSRFAAPQRPYKNALTYLKRASEIPNTKPLEILLEHGYGADGRASVPLLSLLRFMWENPTPPDAAASSLPSIELLSGHCKMDDGADGPITRILDVICNYDGPDEDRQKVRQLASEVVSYPRNRED
ncbi:ankyrin [Thozetella sp. PMI_491]|nr:ankyrin [Thozetella sp. PMI_491]